MAKYRHESIFGSSEMDLSDGPNWTVTTQQPCPACGKTECFDHQLRTKVDQVMSEQSDRARLERDLFDKARELKRLAALHKRYVAPAEIAKANIRYRAAEEDLFAAVTLLESF